MGRNENAAVEQELEKTRERAARAEQQLSELQQKVERLEESANAPKDGDEGGVSQGGEEALRQEPMMAHLMDSLEAGKDIGHYGRLVFAMIARHFMTDDELRSWLSKDPDFDDNAARALIRQVEGRDYNPPRRDRIVAWQKEQEFPILPNADDPDCGNVYRSLKFPDSVYEHIQEYQQDKAES